MRFAVYGSLRPGEYNYNPHRSSIVAENVRLKGFVLQNLGAYPAAIRRTSQKLPEWLTDDVRYGGIVCDIIDVNHPEEVSRIHSMELAAGYTLGLVRLGQGTTADDPSKKEPIYFYYMNDPAKWSLASDDPMVFVVGGDWSRKLNNTYNDEEEN